jgi:hypothetical protein
MVRKSLIPKSRYHLWLYDDDLEFLERRLGNRAPTAYRLGVGAACREIIHAKVKQLRHREMLRRDAIAARELIEFNPEVQEIVQEMEEDDAE